MSYMNSVDKKFLQDLVKIYATRMSYSEGNYLVSTSQSIVNMATAVFKRTKEAEKLLIGKEEEKDEN